MKGITSRSEDYSRWYTDVVQKAEMADYSPVKGCMIIRPYGYAIWEGIQRTLDAEIKATGHQNAYFPLFIPESFLKKEAQHVEGFAPECAVVTHGGGAELEEPLYVRPTSETIMYSMFAKWINSYRDLPLLINQWANIVRWEMRTRLFLRTTEFLWQEGHTAHATAEEAQEETLRMLEVYRAFVEDVLAVPVLVGEKSAIERFAGAVSTYTIEAMMQDKKALQCGTSHNLGQNFSKPFEVTYQTRQGQLEYVWQTSWGVSTRLVGALVMAHADDQGLVLPPRIAPISVVIVPIYRDPDARVKTVAMAQQIKESLGSKLAVKVDDRDEHTPGWKFNEWELKGVPVRLEIGPKDLEKNQVVLVRRDTGEKTPVNRNLVASRVPAVLDEIQHAVYEKALKFREANTITVDTLDQLVEVMEAGCFARCHWGGNGTEAEEVIKQKTKATLRCIPFNEPDEPGACIVTGKPSQKRVIFAKAY
ncbi:MAG: proline--tRNA ligase [Verrucomicrobia bacterium]|nr:proline--tRNA ligase [Verrucomicrobiota bacterium]